LGEGAQQRAHLPSHQEIRGDQWRLSVLALKLPSIFAAHTVYWTSGR
jgi:hypothetical protein